MKIREFSTLIADLEPQTALPLRNELERGVRLPSCLLLDGRTALPPMLLVAVKAFLTCLTHATSTVFALADDLTDGPPAQGMVEALPLIVEMMRGPGANVALVWVRPRQTRLFFK